MLFAIPLLLAFPAVAALALLALRHRWQVVAWLSAIYGATIGVFAILAGAYVATEDRAIEEGAVFWISTIGVALADLAGLFALMWLPGDDANGSQPHETG